MGKGGKGKGNKTNAPATAPPSDDALIEQAIAEANEKRATWWGADGPLQEGAHKLGKKEIVDKLNAIPTFCLLSGENSFLSLKDMTDKTGRRNIVAWFTDPKQATDMLAQVKTHSPNLAGLHLGITPLGVAYSFATGWGELKFNGDKQVHGSMESMESIEAMRQQAVEHGLEARAWHVPVFTCAELATPARMPFFLSQKALAESWLVSGRKLSDLDAVKVPVLDLGVIVHQMQTGQLDGRTVHFLPERRAVALVNETNQPGTVPRAEVPPGKEPTREEAIAAIQQALLAQVASLHGEDSKGDGKVPLPTASLAAEEPPPLT